MVTLFNSRTAFSAWSKWRNNREVFSVRSVLHRTEVSCEDSLLMWWLEGLVEKVAVVWENCCGWSEGATQEHRRRRMSATRSPYQRTGVDTADWEDSVCHTEPQTAYIQELLLLLVAASCLKSYYQSKPHLVTHTCDNTISISMSRLHWLKFMINYNMWTKYFPLSWSEYLSYLLSRKPNFKNISSTDILTTLIHFWKWKTLSEIYNIFRPGSPSCLCL
jgi:hypothetical protein